MFNLFKNKKIANQKKSSQKKGFTMMELVVVMAIFGILTSITVYNYGKFNGNIIMTNMAYEIALSVREAQVYSLGVRGSDGNFDTRYGIYFNINNSQNFVFFADRIGNKICEINEETGDACSIEVCDDESKNECETLNTLTRGINIVKICGSVVGVEPMDFETGNCSSGASNMNVATITFERPNPDAFVYNMDSGAIAEELRNISVLIEANNGAKRAVYIRENGQISVEFINN
jgi:prepilin-type N-terminal cleavage/methylation domain-containing protein